MDDLLVCTLCKKPLDEAARLEGYTICSGCLSTFERVEHSHNLHPVDPHQARADREGTTRGEAKRLNYMEGYTYPAYQGRGEDMDEKGTPKVVAVRRLTFEAGHRVVGHEGECRSLHGHSYKVLVEASASELDSVGRVIDFSVLKDKIGGWIDQNWDHAMILYERDIPGLAAMNAFRDQEEYPSRAFLLFYNPTAENLARFLLETVCPEVLRETGVEVRKVTVWETENCFAEAGR